MNICRNKFNSKKKIKSVYTQNFRSYGLPHVLTEFLWDAISTSFEVQSNQFSTARTMWGNRLQKDQKLHE